MILARVGKRSIISFEQFCTMIDACVQHEVRSVRVEVGPTAAFDTMGEALPGATLVAAAWRANGYTAIVSQVAIDEVVIGLGVENPRLALVRRERDELSLPGARRTSDAILALLAPDAA